MVSQERRHAPKEATARDKGERQDKGISEDADPVSIQIGTPVRVPAAAGQGGAGAEGSGGGGGPDLRGEQGNPVRLDQALPGRRAGGTDPEAGRREGEAEDGSCSREAGRSGGSAAGAPRMGNAADQRRPETVSGVGGVGDSGAADPARGGAAAGAGEPGTSTGAPTASLRASGSEPDVAVRHFHLSAAAARAAVPGRIHGRPLPLHRVVRAGAPAEVGTGDGGTGTRHRGVRGASGDSDGPRAAVRVMAREDGLRGRAATPRNRPHQEPPAAPADAGEGGAILEDAVGGISLADGLCRLCGL